MIGFIKHPKTFEAVEQVEIYNYSVPMEALTYEEGTVEMSVPSEDRSGFILTIDELEMDFFISNFENIDKGVSTIKVMPIDNLFDLHAIVTGSSIASAMDTFFPASFNPAGNYVREGITYSMDYWRKSSSPDNRPFTPTRRAFGSLNGKPPIKYALVDTGPVGIQGVSGLVYSTNVGGRIAPEEIAEDYDDTLVVNYTNIVNVLKQRGYNTSYTKTPPDDYGRLMYRTINNNLVGRTVIAKNGFFHITSAFPLAYPYDFVVASGSGSGGTYRYEGRMTSGETYHLTDLTSYAGVFESHTIPAPFVPSNDVVFLNIDKAQLQENTPISFGDGHTELLTETYNNRNISHVTIIFGASQYNYYLKSDGDIVSTEADMVRGEHVIKAAGNDATGSWAGCKPDAEEIFAGNTKSHKIEFASDYTYHFGQTVVLMLDRAPLLTKISAVIRKNTDERTFYRCGDLDLSASEIIRANTWFYGKALPMNPRKGQLAIID